MRTKPGLCPFQSMVCLPCPKGNPNLFGSDRIGSANCSSLVRTCVFGPIVCGLSEYNIPDHNANKSYNLKQTLDLQFGDCCCHLLVTLAAIWLIVRVSECRYLADQLPTCVFN